MIAPYDKYNLPHVGGHISRILASRHLIPSITPKGFIREHNGKKHRYTAICTKPDGSKIIFYARLHKNMDAFTKFRHEIRFLRSLKKSRSTLSQFVPRLITSSLGPKGEWFTRQYLTTKVLGTIHTVKMPLHISDVPKFRNLFHALQKIPKISGTTLERRGGDFYLSMSEGCLKSAKAYFSGSDVQRIRHLLHESFLLLDRTATYMVHGDCHPGNILYDRAHTFVIDWELMHINNRVNDFGYFYAGLAPHPAFRRALLKSYAASLPWKKEFRQLFPVNVLFFSLNHLATLKHVRPKELSAREYVRVLAFAKQVVKRAITSYTALEQL